MQISWTLTFLTYPLILGVMTAANAAEIGTTKLNIQANVLSESCTQVIDAENEGALIDMGDISMAAITKAYDEGKRITGTPNNSFEIKFTCSSGSKAFFSINPAGTEECFSSDRGLQVAYKCSSGNKSIVFSPYFEWKSAGGSMVAAYGSKNIWGVQKDLFLNSESQGVIKVKYVVLGGNRDMAPVPGAASTQFVISVWEN